MKFALASCGTRGDVEPCAAVGLELVRRGHDVRMAAPPDQVGFVESVGLSAVGYGPAAGEIPDFFRSPWRIHDPIAPVREAMRHANQRWADISAALMSLADGADLLMTGMPYQEAAANVAEYYDMAMAAWHHVPMRANGHLLPMVPPPVLRSAMKAVDWVQWRMTKKVDDAQRRDLGLPKATGPASLRMAERGALEIQAYDDLFFPGLAAEWAGRRPFVGALTLELPTAVDAEVAAWIARGTPPIYFGFGSMRVESPADTVAMISTACARLGERALISLGAHDPGPVFGSDRVKVVGALGHAAIFPACRAVVHHGGAGTTAAGLRAGMPTLILWVAAEQPIWAAQVKRLGVGAARSFSRTTEKSLMAGLERILAPACATRAREVATRMTTAADSAAKAADLLEDAARRRRFG